MRITIIICLFLLAATGTFSQSIDSLKNELLKAIKDSIRCKILYEIVQKQPEGWEKYNDEIIFLCNNKKSNYFKEHLKSAIEEKAISLGYKGRTDEALKLFSTVMKMNKEAGDEKGCIGTLCNQAALYKIAGDYDFAINNFLQVKKKAKEIGYSEAEMAALNFIGEIYVERENYDSALFYYNQALELSIRTNNKPYIVQGYYGIGLALQHKKDYGQSIKFYKKGLDICDEIYHITGKQNGLISIAYLLYEQKNYKEAISYGLEGLKLSQKNGIAQQILQSAKVLKNSYKALGQPAKALEMYELQIKMKDSIVSEKNRKAMIRNQIQTEYEKKALADSLRAENAKNKIVMENEVEMNRQQNQKLVLYLGLALVLVFSIVIYKRFQITRKQKLVIERHQKEITDSINYAKRLQEAILPTQEQFNLLLPNNFILYKPKDIVAGDFYWLENLGNTVFFAAADCTGHGVPGAMVSMVCSNALTRVVLENGITEPGQILNEVRKIVVSTFEKSGSDIKDGMDISLCALNNETCKLQWAGANNPLWYFKDGQIIEVKADKQPIGKADNPKPFTTHTIQLDKGDIIYVFTDGYADQFGGPKGKKFKYKQLEEVLLRSAIIGIEDGNSLEQMVYQKQQLSSSFDSWKGSLEQVDDVCIIGVRA